jgi:hypothetical protein
MSSHHPLAREENGNHQVCRFIVQGLVSRRGRARSDFHVDLLTSVDGLLTLVMAVYGVLNKNSTEKESYRCVKWRLNFDGVSFGLCDADIHQFQLLQSPLRDGQTGWFKGASVSFRFSVERACTKEISSGMISSYPKIQVIRRGISFSSSMDHDWLSADKRARALQFRQDFREYVDGANIWKKEWSGDYFRDHPKAHTWTSEEDDILYRLIKSGNTFQDCWKSILQYGFVNRSEVGTSQEWYNIRKNRTSPQIDQDPSKPELIVKAKRRCAELMEKHLQAGIPVLGKHPSSETDGDVLTELEDGIRPEMKRQKLESLHPRVHWEGCGEEQSLNQTSEGVNTASTISAVNS